MCQDSQRRMIHVHHNIRSCTTCGSLLSAVLRSLKEGRQGYYILFSLPPTVNLHLTFLLIIGVNASPNLCRYVTNLSQSTYENEGGVHFCVPQVTISKRLFLVLQEECSWHPGSHPLQYCICLSCHTENTIKDTVWVYSLSKLKIKIRIWNNVKAIALFETFEIIMAVKDILVVSSILNLRHLKAGSLKGC